MPILTLRLVGKALVTYVSAMRVFGNIIAVLMCLGLIFQVSAEAASLSQAETMTLADCAKMKHHASDHSGHAGQNQNDPCDDMSLKCMLSMNAVAPVLMGNTLPNLSNNLPPNTKQFFTAVTDQLAGRALPPDYPPPRF
ncbi:hypothetical protein [Qipengyuania sp. DGS5-3]|uniref:hypothetical protein n=1 Tax=Qipengyuania sp. DGS5-3 TaxID=3349632 RepID=UPI0036D3F5E8